MKIIVAGANGLIGKHLVAALRGRGDDVGLLVRAAVGDAGWARGCASLLWDGRTQGLWGRSVDGADAVINLSGANVSGARWSDDYKRQILESRTQSTAALVQAMGAAARKPRVFINASAVGFYGPRGEEAIDESAAAGSDFLSGVVRAWEEEAQAAEKLGIRTVMLRTGVVLAKDGGALKQMLPPFRAFVGGPVGTGKQWFPWIHMADEVGLFEHALDREEVRGPVNATAPGIVTMKDFARALGKVLHRPSWAAVPEGALKLLLGEFASVLTSGQRVVPARALASGYEFRFPSLPEALQDLLVAEAPRSAA